MALGLGEPRLQFLSNSTGELHRVHMHCGRRLAPRRWRSRSRSAEPIKHTIGRVRRQNIHMQRLAQILPSPLHRPLRTVVRSRMEALSLAAVADNPQVILDLEPIVASWGTNKDTMRQGISDCAALLGSRPVLLMTNSGRQLDPKELPDGWNLVTRARKPFSQVPYTCRHQRCIVLGDQLFNDGILALRIGADFIHFTPPPGSPFWPRFANWLSTPLILAFRP